MKPVTNLDIEFHRFDSNGHPVCVTIKEDQRITVVEGTPALVDQMVTAARARHLDRNG